MTFRLFAVYHIIVLCLELGDQLAKGGRGVAYLLEEVVELLLVYTELSANHIFDSCRSSSTWQCIEEADHPLELVLPKFSNGVLVVDVGFGQ